MAYDYEKRIYDYPMENPYGLVNAEAKDLWDRFELPYDFAVASGGLAWVQQNRIPECGPLDMEQLAIIRDITFDKCSELGPVVLGETRFTKLEDGIVEIDLSENLRTEQRRFVFGHEIGHYFLCMVSDVKGSLTLSNDYDERICDVFGYELALPQSELNAVDRVNEATVLRLMKAFDVDVVTVLVQLMRTGKLATNVALDTGFSKYCRTELKGKIGRDHLCLPCLEEWPDHPEITEDVPVLFFPSTDWSRYVRGCDYYNPITYGHPDFDDLNRQYGITIA